jgi:RNA-directed DNA polymerase
MVEGDAPTFASSSTIPYQNSTIRAGTKPDTFDFLGLTHKCALSRRGKFTVHVKTMKKRLRRSFKAVAEWCRTHRHDAVDQQQAILNAKLRGHYQYYGIPTNYRSLWQFYRGVRRTWKQWLEPRTRGQPLGWEKYAQILGADACSTKAPATSLNIVCRSTSCW